MSVEFVQIAFDHNGPPGTHALHIRNDGATPAPPNVAAYPLVPTEGKQLTIGVTLKFPNPGGGGLASGTVVRVRAQATSASSQVLGNVQARKVAVPAAGSRQATFQFDLFEPKLHAKGVGKYTVVWKWQFQLAGTSSWVTFHTSTATIYITLDVPTPPWTQDIDDVSKRRWPWTRMLDQACAWAAGVRLGSDRAAALKTIARRIEQGVYGLGDVGKLDYLSGGPGHYVVGKSDGRFRITAFLKDLEGPEQGLNIHCTECAVVVATAANCLGGDLALKRIDRAGSIHLNSYLLIGRTAFNQGSFGFHDIAVRRGASSEQVFDATLKPDWHIDAPTEHDFRLTQGRRLGKREVKPKGTAYLQRLLEADVAVQWTDLNMNELTMPSLDRRDGQPGPDSRTNARFEFCKQAVRTEVGMADSVQRLQFAQPARMLAPAIEGFTAVRRIDDPPWLSALAPLVGSSVEYRYVAASGEHGGFTLAVSWSPTPEAAEETMAWLMARTPAPLEAWPNEKIGDALRVSPSAGVIYLLRGNMVVHVASRGKTLAPTEMIARSLDRTIVNNWSGPFEPEIPPLPPSDD